MAALTHQHYMSQAMQLAERGRYTVSPNPMVGCVIVNDQRIVGRGFHERAGEAHAEVHALQEAGSFAKGATAYVTLEPCNHWGRTPPCTKSLIEAGISTVYVACLDPNPLVAGKGVACLRDGGIVVNIGLCEIEAKQLNEVFFHYITTKRPFVICKWAMSLDGKTIVHSADSKQITGDVASYHTHELRHQVDAILVGSNTARLDDPQLTVRNNKLETDKIKQPIRIVLNSQGDLPLNLRIFQGVLPGQTIVVTSDMASKAWCDAVRAAHVELLILPTNNQGRISLADLLDVLGERELSCLLVEGGMTIHDSFFKENLVNKLHVYVAPVFIGTSEKKLLLQSPEQLNRLGDDIHISLKGRSNSHV